MTRSVWTNDKIQYLKEHYPYDNYDSMCEYLQCTLRALKHISNELRLKRNRGYIINQTFFDTWSHDMAYILGFTITDGCIGDDDRLSFGVAEKDTCILDYISKNLAPGKLSSKYIQHHKKGGVYHTSYFKFTSKYIAKQLSKYYVVPRKTGLEKLPICPEEFKNDLLRGIFDGDGWAHISNKKTGQVTFTICSASESFLKSIQENLGFNFGYVRQVDMGPGSLDHFRWCVYKQKDVRLLADYMYSTNGFCLERKRKIFYE